MESQHLDGKKNFFQHYHQFRSAPSQDFSIIPCITNGYIIFCHFEGVPFSAQSEQSAQPAPHTVGLSHAATRRKNGQITTDPPAHTSDFSRNFRQRRRALPPRFRFRPCFAHGARREKTEFFTAGLQLTLRRPAQANVSNFRKRRSVRWHTAMASASVVSSGPSICDLPRRRATIKATCSFSALPEPVNVFLTNVGS